MRPLLHLTFEALLDLLRAQFRQVPDQRDPKRITWKLHDVLMSGFAMFFFQHPALLQFQQSMEKKTGKSNLQRLFKVKDVPSDTQMRTLLDDPAAQAPLRRVLPQVFERMRQTGWAIRFVNRIDGVNYYTVVLDGSQYFHSTKIECPSCLQRRDKNGEIHYSHVVVGATIVRAGSHEILPLDAEEVRNTDGSEKQDCELNASKRLVKRLREEHRQLQIVIGGDDLYAHEPFILELRALGMNFVLVAKPESHQELYEWVEDLDRLGQCVKGEWEEGPLAKRRYFKYRIASQVPLTQSDKVLVNFVEVWELDKEDQVIYHNAWVTDFEVRADNVATIVGIGRSRWKIENEQFNTQKNHGYELEHNYGHGERGLSMVFYLLNLLAFLAHQVLEMGDRLYRACRANESRRSLWQALRVYFKKLAFESWTAMLEFHLSDPDPDP
jgi:hypothetical protein